MCKKKKKETRQNKQQQRHLIMYNELPLKTKKTTINNKYSLNIVGTYQ